MRRGLLFLIGATVSGILAAVLAVRTVNSFNETDTVVVAVRDIQPYTAIKPDDVKLAPVPRVMVLPETIRDPVRDLKKAVGRYTKDMILAGDIVRQSRLASVEGDRILGARLTQLNDPKLRAFALPFDPASAVGGKIRPGDKVDVIASVKIDAGQGVSMGVGKIVAQAVEVLELTGGDGGSSGTIVLALKPDQIEDIAFALTSGQLRFALNPYNTDVTAAQTQGVTGRQWLEKYGFLGQQQSVQQKK